MKLELTHDVLARKIGQKAGSEEKKLRRIEKMIRDAYELHISSGHTAYMSANDLDYVFPYLDKTDIHSEHRTFLQKNREHLREERKKWIIRISVISAAVVLLSLGAYALSESLKNVNAELTEKKKKIDMKKGELDSKKEVLSNQKKTLEEKTEEMTEKERKIEESLKKQQVLKENIKKKKEEGYTVQRQMEEKEKEINPILKGVTADLNRIAEEARKKEIEESKTAIEGKEWSEYIGEMDWNSAVKACEEKETAGDTKWRLPTKQEFTGVFHHNKLLLEKWQKEKNGWYWTKDAFSDDSAFRFLIVGGNSFIYRKDDGYVNVRCIR